MCRRYSGSRRCKRILEIARRDAERQASNGRLCKSHALEWNCCQARSSFPWHIRRQTALALCGTHPVANRNTAWEVMHTNWIICVAAGARQFRGLEAPPSRGKRSFDNSRNAGTFTTARISINPVGIDKFVPG